ncbi:hypothetical protein CROQUDRAFT_356806 [Cronartium quercuum f. sp. fusiforme G11]|uniref:Uncharacterized protein n=1 Tax=Cronartium quercuum f. sp. fusiforme G11 TaxID=708437 RepID=A0A9P6NA48_9BASI|nr:hypothetical protein CROQUDRAFT_356806 [Cronartium quercuum f. sp. fusiforme G11]
MFLNIRVYIGILYFSSLLSSVLRLPYYPFAGTLMLTAGDNTKGCLYTLRSLRREEGGPKRKRNETQWKIWQFHWVSVHFIAYIHT